MASRIVLLCFGLVLAVMIQSHGALSFKPGENLEMDETGADNVMMNSKYHGVYQRYQPMSIFSLQRQRRDAVKPALENQVLDTANEDIPLESRLGKRSYYEGNPYYRRTVRRCWRCNSVSTCCRSMLA